MKSNEGMSTPFEQLEARVAFLERELRRTVVIIDNIEMRTDTRLKTVNEHLDKQDTEQQKFSASVDQRFEHVYGDLADIKSEQQKFSANVDQRFEHVYGELSDIKSDTVEIRNILATLVERLNKSS